MVPLPVKHTSTEIGSNPKRNVSHGNRYAEQFFDDLVGLCDIELLSLKVAKRMPRQSVFEAFC